jgi:hypothetical protein
VAVGVAVGSGGSTVGVSGGSGSAAMGVSAGVSVGVPFSASSPDGVSPPGPGGSGVALGCGSVPGSAAGGSSDASAGVGAAVSSCGADVAVRGDVAVSGAVGEGVRRPAVPSGSCATAARTVVVAEGVATTVTCPVDGVTRLGVTVGDTATPPVAVASALAVGGPFCGPQPAAVGVGGAEGLAAVGVGGAVVGVAVLSPDNLARGNLVWPRPDRE